MKPGPKNLITDIDGLKVGNAEDHTLKSGVSVVTADQPFVASYSVMGGAPGTRETDLLEPDKMVEAVDAIVLSGGSAYGLDAASGVVSELRKIGRGFAIGDVVVPIVPTAILFDLLNGGDKSWEENPYPDLGAKAFTARAVDFDLGTVGAGTGARTRNLKGGLGSASYVLENGVTVGALVAVNALGSVATPGGEHLWAAPFEEDNEFGGRGTDPRPALGHYPAEFHIDTAQPAANTTIAIVATDAILDKAGCKRLATAAQDGLTRAIVPAHSPFDGDLVFALSTGKIPLDSDAPIFAEVCHATSITLTRAIGRAIYHAKASPNDLYPCWRDL